MWEFLTTAEYRKWVMTLQDQDRARLQRIEQRLIAEGPLLHRPHTDTVQGSSYTNKKEGALYRWLRQTRVWRVGGGLATADGL